MKKKLFVLLLSIISVACLAFGVSACSKTKTDDIAVTSVSISSTEISLEVGESYTLSATILPSNATNTNVTWSSSATSVATVSDGKVTAVSVGTAIITVTTTDGGYTDTCTVKVEETPTHIHSYTSVITAPTCTEGGYTTYTCECGDSYTDDYTNALEHSWDEGKVTTEPACTTDGVKTYTCTVCNETKTETISATDHTEAESVTENEVAATCTEDGSYDSVIYCSVCSAELSRETITIPATGHDYDEDDFCTICSKHKPTEGLSYTYNGSDGGYSVSIDSVTDTDIYIAETYDDSEYGSHPVTTIADFAFMDCNSLTSITIPDSVTSIGNAAFGGCTSLTSVNIPDSVTSVGSYAFYYCTSLTSVNIPDSVTSIGNAAFRGCTSLTSITIPDSVTSIGSYAFYECISLTSITIPDSVASIGSYAFYECISLTSITIPDSIITISDYAFFDCSSLTSITIPDSVITISDCAFYGCSSLTSVYYNGTADGGSNISIGSNNNDLTSATIYYYSATAVNGCWYYDADGSVKIWYYTRVDENGDEDGTGDYVYFGSYPQTLVTDTTITTALGSLAGTLPTSSESYDWTSYGYYISSSNSADYMWYIDITYNGETYRGVYFTSYRPNFTSNPSSTSYSFQDDNGYSTNTLYWFKYEPILWRILTTEEADGATYATILCEMLIDSQEYNYTTSSATLDDGTIVYANNYAYSSIRAWLNDNFYNTAFSELEKSLIQFVEVDNSASTTSSNFNPYACENTYDYVWLLSYQDMLYTECDFNKTTDYAQCQGAYSSDLDDGRWWLRSPVDDNSDSAEIAYDGYHIGGYTDNYTGGGVRPALKIRLS